MSTLSVSMPFASMSMKSCRPLEMAQETERTQSLRKEYCENLLPLGVNYMDNCIFVDEAGFNSRMVPGRARSLKGKKITCFNQDKTC